MKELNRQIYRFDNFQLDAGNRQLRRDDKPLSLPPKAFDLLLALVENNGRLVEKDVLFTSVWQDQIVEESNLPVHISQIRKALGETKNNPRFIETVPGYGYRFVGELQDFADNELIIETETLSRITIEKEEMSDAEILESGKPGIDKNEAVRKNRVKKYFVAAGAILICLTLAFGVYFLSVRKSDVPFEKIKFTRLTNNGKVSAATLSSDGKFIAYVLSEAEGNSIWVRQTSAANDTRIVPPVKVQIWELTFTPDGAHLFYNLFRETNSTPELFRISTLGGVSERIPNVIASFIGFAPDGKRFAYGQSDSAAGQNYLVVADADGTNQQTIAAKNYPNTFETQVPVVAWSPDGETIACLVNHFEADTSYSLIVGINVRDGSEKLLSEQRWYDVFSIEWLKNGSGLLISASDAVSGNNQIRFLSYPNGEARKITNDLSRYDSLSATADGKSFVTIQTNKTSGIFVGEAGADDFKEIVSETGELHPFVWTHDGKIVFRSHKDSVSNLWTMDADGGNRRQLTINAQVDSRGLCLSPDGKYLVFASWRSGKSNLWRVDADGKNLMQLTDGEADTRPQYLPDGQSVVYQKGLQSKPTLWKVNPEGGEAVQLTEFYAKWNAISTDGRRISFFQMVDSKWRIGIISSTGGAILQRLDVPASLKENEIRWSPDDRSLFYISTIGNVGNVWTLPLDGTETKPVTNFKSHYLEDFSWSPDGTKLAVSRSLQVSDVVLIEKAE